MVAIQATKDYTYNTNEIYQSGKVSMLKSAIIAEDSDSVLSFNKQLLASLNVGEIACCKNGKEALDLVTQDPLRWECIVTDLHMPVMDGLELLEALGEMQYRGGVIIASALEERIVQLAVDIALSHKVHLVGSLSKPLSEIELIRLIQKSKEIKGHVPNEVSYIKQRQLLTSISEKRIIPYYQPKVDIKTNELVGLEVLCRLDWPHEHEVVTPERFIPVAEKFELIDLLTLQLMEQTLKEYPHILQASEPLIPKLAFNISPLQLYNASFPTLVGELCDRLGVPRQQVIFEVTERQLLNENKQLTTLDRLRVHKFGLSLDDFGTGFTNIRQLREFPFTEVKVDQCLIKNISADRVSQVILGALTGIAEEFNMNLVAEGIEQITDYKYILEHHRVVAQGFLISRPKPLDELLRWYSAWQHSHPH